MPLDKQVMLIEVESVKHGGKFEAKYEIETSKLAVYSGPLAKISIQNLVGPDSYIVMPAEDFINKLLLEFAKAFWNVQEMKLQ